MLTLFLLMLGFSILIGVGISQESRRPALSNVLVWGGLVAVCILFWLMAVTAVLGAV